VAGAETSSILPVLNEDDLIDLRDGDSAHGNPIDIAGCEIS
jgi:hypothetical protein